MNLEKITYKIIKESIKDDFILRMMISYLSDDQKGAVMDEIVNEREHILFKKEDIVWFDPVDNKYDLKDAYESDILKDALIMNKQGHIKATIIDDCGYRSNFSGYATEYKIMINFSITCKEEAEYKTIRVRRSNIIKLWMPLA